MKMVMIMVILILALMTVIGAFLISGVGNFYISEFYVQMERTFSPEFITQLQDLADGENGPTQMKELLMAQTGLGIDVNDRNVYILDSLGQVLEGSDERTQVSVSQNLLTAMNGEVGQELEGLMEAAGMKCLAYYTRGPRYITSNRKITCVADCNNLVIRTPQSAMTVAAFQALGAKPTPMALSEVFTSLQQGTIDAVEMFHTAYATSGFAELCKYYVNTNDIYTCGALLLSAKVWNGMSEADQKVFTDAAATMVATTNSQLRDMDESSREKIVNELVEEAFDLDKSELRAMVQPVYNAHPEYSDFVAQVDALAK